MVGHERSYVRKLTSTTNKKARITALEPYVNQGRIRFTKRHNLLLEQLRMFPLGVHDDGPDALEMACQEGLGRVVDEPSSRFERPAEARRESSPARSYCS